ncbi:MAG: AAA family ATPase [Candidatus Hermodarchaeota archaeon]
MSKFYGECIAEDSLVITNSGGLKTIGEAIQENEVHSVAGLNFKTGKVEILPVKEIFDKGVQNTLKIITPHGRTEVTPTSKLLVLHKGKPTWVFADDLKVGDQVASPRSLSMEKTEIPLILPYLPNRTLISGSLVQSLFSKTSGYGKNKEFAQKLDVTQRKFEEFKYGRKKIPAVYIKRLFSFFPEKKQFFLELSKNRKVPLYMTEDLMYIIGLLSGDGHLRYSPSAGTGTQIILTSTDLNIQDRYSKAVKATFNVELTIDPDSSNTLYFNSKPIGDLLHNLGIPFSRKSHHIKVPPYIINLPQKYLSAYLQGLYDADGDVQYADDSKEPKNIQINYSTVSKELAMGIRLCLLRLGIVSTLSYRKRDANWRVHISDVESIDKFRLKISFNHKERYKRLNEDLRTKYTRHSYDRIPIARWIYEIGKPLGITQRELLQYNINPKVKGLTRDQLQKAHRLLSEKGLDQIKLDLIQKLIDQEVIWTPIREIKKSRSHVYDFEVPSHHNFIANGLLVHNSEARLRDIFKEAEKTSPSIIFIDEIDAIAPKREEVTGEVERRVVAQILSLMDGLESRGQTIVIGATNRVNALDPALRRPGRFDREIEISVPDKTARLEILQIHTRRMPGIEEVDLETLAEITHGFVGADLAALAREAAMRTLREILPKINLEEEAIPAEVLEDLKVGMNHFKSALKEIQPTAVREVFLEVPNVRWTDVGGLEEAKQELVEVVEWPLKQRENIQRMGINPPNGVLLYGPPGSGKTLLAKAVATESEANFIAIKGPELISKWVGESEKAIREIFRKARTASPAIIFFDEIDATAVRRGLSDSTLVNERVISQLLTEMDGMEPLTDVIVIAATNRPDMIDPALLRPGRIDRLINIPPPSPSSREKIFEIHTKGMPLAEDVDLQKLAKQTDSYVGADIELICREAAMLALRENLDAKNVYQRHFEEAMKAIHPSVTPELLKMYEDLEKNLKRRYTAEKQPHFFG